ncbi:MAG: hypothetical protein EBW81_02015 [Gammaproteobacteria bacterium]|nr:hypothetical protein [Gammaproteobacteria bacterium]
MMNRRAFLALSAAGLLTGCGFRLRGTGTPMGQLPESLRIETTDPYSPIVQNITRQLKDQWLSAYPEMRLYFDDVGALIGARGGRATVTHAVSGRLRGGCSFTAACNTFFQGLVADGAKRALYLLTRAAYAERYDLHVRPVAFIHDEIIIECPEEQATEAAELLTRCMVEGMQAYTPDIPVVVEAAAMRRWYKDAAPVWRGDRLMPWAPKEEQAR